MRENRTVQSAFGTVVIVVSALGIAGAVVALLLGRRPWEGYGKGLVRDSELDDRQQASTSPAPGEREEEIRQMLEARNALRRRRGEAELDVEVYRAPAGPPDAPPVDPELRDEIRELVVARNHRRARQGKPPLDVEAEVARQIAELGRD